MDRVSPGSRINVTIVKQPSNAGAVKTLVRVLSKDRKVQAENKRLRKVRDRHFRSKRRGGRDYPLYVVKQRPIKGERGESGTVIASPDVLSDLRSVRRFIEVSNA